MNLSDPCMGKTLLVQIKSKATPNVASLSITDLQVTSFEIGPGAWLCFAA